MKIALIDNGTQHLDDLKELLSPHSVRVFNLGSYQVQELSSFDAIILSGGSKYSVIYDEEKYKKELDLIKNTGTPVFGICIGFELICHAFGENLERRKEKRKGIYTVEMTEKDSITRGLEEEIKAYQAHKWHVKQVNFLKELGRSKDCVEVIKKPGRSIWGVQFHPEVKTEETDGYKLVENFLENI